MLAVVVVVVVIDAVIGNSSLPAIMIFYGSWINNMWEFYQHRFKEIRNVINR